MKPTLTAVDVSKLQGVIESSQETQSEQLVGLIVPAVGSLEISLSHYIEDLAQDTAMGFSEVHGKIEYLRTELHELKQTINSLFR